MGFMYLLEQFFSLYAWLEQLEEILPLSSISDLKLQLGIGTLLMWCGCSFLQQFTFGVANLVVLRSSMISF
jgi:hypothetical protein